MFALGILSRVPQVINPSSGSLQTFLYLFTRSCLQSSSGGSPLIYFSSAFGNHHTSSSKGVNFCSNASENSRSSCLKFTTTSSGIWGSSGHSIRSSFIIFFPEAPRRIPSEIRLVIFQAVAPRFFFSRSFCRRSSWNSFRDSYVFFLSSAYFLAVSHFFFQQFLREFHQEFNRDFSWDSCGIDVESHLRISKKNDPQISYGTQVELSDQFPGRISEGIHVRSPGENSGGTYV